MTHSPRFFSVTPLLKSLHWLPVQYRIKYKIYTLTYKVIHKCQPVYLHNLHKPLNRTRILRSSDEDQLIVPRVSSKMGKRAFFCCAPSPLRSYGIVFLMRLQNLNLNHSHFGKMINFVFRSSLPILNPLCSGMLVYKLEQQTDNDSELDSDLQRL